MQGLILLNKPKGITSFSAVNKIKWLASEKRVGHTGTLDPLATGVLPIFIGRATALSGILLDADKSYVATVKLGLTTDTCDITGEVLSEKEVKVTETEFLAVLERFKGKILQVPPMYSALKRDGVRLYELARQGKSVEIPPREVEITRLDLLEFSFDTFKIAVDCSKGTYIRSLCRDIGEALGCGATMTELCRTATSGFTLAQTVSLDDLTRENISDFILPEETALLYMKEVRVTEKQAVRFSNGGQLSYERLKTADFTDGQLLRVKYKDKFLGVGYADNENQQIAIKCVINKWSVASDRQRGN
ncbi:MAG: tRNA pseudouridine(55) synthase TruB [Acutalibacteraceae bacterium]|nr:tRNA pseudouridine(55) synthase TruB [Acutalibacteraceae bacterium]